MMNRRAALQTLLLASGAMLSACCCRRYPGSSIADDPQPGLPQILKPPRINKRAGTPAFCIDVHAHFFNAADVPVRGFLEGPVAHTLKEPLRTLVRALGPFAETLAELAPDANQEFRELLGNASPNALVGESSIASKQLQIDTHSSRISTQVYDILKGSDFERQFNAIKNAQPLRANGLLAPESAQFGPETLQAAMARGTRPGGQGDFQLPPGGDYPPYADGVLAFLGYMLSYRWMNLVAYQQAYSSSSDSFGMDQVFGSLVDFDRWLDCAPRSSQEDQIKLHQLISQLSGGYMRPLVAYNPWSDIVDEGKALARVTDAVTNRGFVGVKIYPPMGFRPYGNAENPVTARSRPPSPAELDAAMLRLWEECTRLNVPVMAHTAESMGSNDHDDELGGPKGWRALLNKFHGTKPPMINVGHFGGDVNKNNWSDELAALMSETDGSAMFGDLGYWRDLRCNGTKHSCDAKPRMEALLQHHPQAAKRIMYGSDWLMISQERNWNDYAREIAAATEGLLSAEDLFGGNAKRCFPRAFA